MQNKITYKFFLSLGLVGSFFSLLLFMTIFRHMPQVTNFISGLYLVSLLFGYSCLIWFLVSTICFFSYKLSRSLIPTSFIFSLSLLLFYLDTKIYSIYRSHLSRGLLEYAVNEALGELKRVGTGGILPFFLGLFILSGLAYFLIKLAAKKISNQHLKPIKHIYLAALTCFILTQLTYMYVDVINYIPIKKWTRHIPFYQPLTARRAMFKYGIVDSSKVRDFEIQSAPSDSSINYPKELSCSEKESVKPNILWLFIDTWRKDEFSQKTTPNIYNWVQENSLHTFSNHWSVGNETIPSLFAMFYGVPGLYIKSFTESGTTPIFISKLLKEKYELLISTGWPLDNTSLTKNVFREVPNLRVSIGDKKAWQSDRDMKKELFDFLDNRDKANPFFSFMIFDSAHDYSLPKGYKAPFVPFAEKLNYLSLGPNTDPKPYRNKYRNSVHYIDKIVGDILSSDKIHDNNRPTIILIASDHGEQFNDLQKNFWGHSSNFSRYQLQVPLFIKWNGFKPQFESELQINDQNTTHSHMTTHNDMSHTFLESVFGCHLNKNQSVGFNLYSKTERLPLMLSTYSRHGVLTKDRIYDYRIGQGYEVFDYDYNEVAIDKIPKEIFNQYLEYSSRFYN